MTSEPNRYDRQTRLPEIGPEGQARLARATILVAGLGGLGCAATPWLARAGVGRLILVDPAQVDLPDLHRQILYTKADLGRPKVQAAAQALAQANPHLQAEPVPLALDANNLPILARQADLLLDGTDQTPPRQAMNAYAVARQKPAVFAGASAWAAHVLTVTPGSPCRECAFADTPAPAVCSDAGIFPPVVAWAGAVQAAEALRILLQIPHPPQGTLVTYDALHQTTRRLKLTPNPQCPICQSAKSSLT